MNEHSVEGYQIIDELAEKDPMVKIIGKSQVLLNIYIQLYREGSKRFLKLV